jgi:hypothetical protein
MNGDADPDELRRGFGGEAKSYSSYQLSAISYQLMRYEL